MTRRRGRRCEVLEVDGATIRVQISGRMTDEDREALVDVLRAARDRFLAEHPLPDPPPRCCCNWGAAVGNRGRGPSEELPEFPCYRCPRHAGAEWAHASELCRRHRALAEVVEATR